eukprot:gnl/Chilomastix_caulleri/5950.p1 GENE.gnl/Chilomastix_caulleri/5950~~gnl/Chilomastix_caulleri/5950.p1  ORF type:complete len:96 (+),score=24.91 gnl/Chilomastix_caulleri/5950:95-382(+)
MREYDFFGSKQQQQQQQDIISRAPTLSTPQLYQQQVAITSPGIIPSYAGHQMGQVTAVEQHLPPNEQVTKMATAKPLSDEYEDPYEVIQLLGDEG